MDESKLATYIETGHWSGEYAFLEKKHWKEIIERTLIDFGAIFKNLSGFAPISSLINKIDKRDLAEIEIEMPEDISFGIHCHDVAIMMLDFVELFLKPWKDTSSGETYLLTRKMEWITWKWKMKSVFKKDANGIIVKEADFLTFSSFEKADLIDILAKNEGLGFHIVYCLSEWIEKDVKKEEEMFRKKQEVMLKVRGICQRSFIAWHDFP